MIPPPTTTVSNRSTTRTIGSAAVSGAIYLRARLARSRLYLILEARPRGNDPSSLLDAALRGGVDVVQLREKELRDDDLVRAAEPFRRACDAHGALFVLNDRPDLVGRASADGVHVGQGDVSLADARRAVGEDRLVGLSASTPEELRGDPDYFGVGAVYGTPTKPDAGAGGLELVRAARDTLRVPWFAIGGVDAETVADVAGSGAPGVAVVRAVRDAEDPEAAARALRSALPTTDAVVVRGDAVLLPQIEWLSGTWAPGQRPVAPHTHAAHTDTFYVLDGTMEFRLGDGTVRVPAGSFVAAPPLIVHGFRNPGDVDAPFLNLHAPGKWARGRAQGLPQEDYDMFGPDRASPGGRPSVSAPGDGDRLAKPHRLALVKASYPDLDVLEYFVDDEYDGASRHVHLLHADCFHVFEGALEFRVDGKDVRADAGTSVIVPPGVPHEFTSAGRARFLNVHAPSFGFADYLRKVDAGESVDAAAHDMYELPE
jgi:thiamine-phosphate pyrophosphorylase